MEIYQFLKNILETEYENIVQLNFDNINTTKKRKRIRKN